MLDFSEITSAQPTSTDPDAFEKFSKQFLEVVYGAKVTMLAGHGGDDGIDLLAEVGQERWLVSCKHYRKGIVGIDDEIDPVGRLSRHRCSVFVTIYSCRRSAAHNRSLETLKQNSPGFRYLPLYDSDIESKLLGSQNFETWQLASRWFPRSFAQGFAQLVHPLQQFTLDDIERSERGLRLDAGIIGTFSYSPRNDAAAKQMVFMANEFATMKTHETTFFSRISEFAGTFPGTFKKTIFEPSKIHTVFPSWSMQVLINCMLSTQGLRGPHAICLVWSLWDYDLAKQYMAATHQLWTICHSCDVRSVNSKEHAFEMYKAYHRLDDSVTERTYDDGFNNLSLANTACIGSTLERGYLAGLVAFHPGKMEPSPSQRYMIVKLAESLGETEELMRALDRLRSLCNIYDREYVDTKSPNLAEKIQSLRLSKISDAEWAKNTAGLKCFEADYLEEWRPEARLHPVLAETWGARSRVSS